MPTKRIGVIAAMASEIEALKACLENPAAETISGVEFVAGRFGNVEIIAAKCGIGKVFAALCAQTMILRWHPDLMLNIGVGGSLSKDLNIADVGIAESVVQHDMDTSGLGDEPGMVSGINVVNFPCDRDVVARLAEAAASLGVHTKTGVIASGDVFVNREEMKRRIVDRFSAIVCEMEGGAVAQVCYVNQTPFCVLRAVSDNGDENANRAYADALERASAVALDVIKAYLNTL